MPRDYRLLIENVNEEGYVYASGHSMLTALKTLEEFPNDSIRVTMERVTDE